jgi:hypothetical protein
MQSALCAPSFERSRVNDGDGDMLGRGGGAVIKLTPSGALKRCHAPCGTIATIPAWSAKDRGPSAVMTCKVVAPSTVCTISAPVWVALSGAFAGKFAGEDRTVAIGRQSREGALPLGRGVSPGYAPATS